MSQNTDVFESVQQVKPALLNHVVLDGPQRQEENSVAVIFES